MTWRILGIGVFLLQITVLPSLAGYHLAIWQGEEEHSQNQYKTSLQHQTSQRAEFTETSDNEMRHLLDEIEWVLFSLPEGEIPGPLLDELLSIEQDLQITQFLLSEIKQHEGEWQDKAILVIQLMDELKSKVENLDSQQRVSSI